jgi:hypothetical protein
MKKFIYDTITNKGIFSQKRIMTFSSFFVATTYAFMPVFIPTFDVKEFVFIGFLAAGGWSLYRTQKPNENITTPTNEETGE